MKPAKAARTCELRARWHGDPPVRGDYLKAPRGRTAYRVLATRRIDPRRNGKRYGYIFTVERVLPEDIPPGARVCEWNWDPR